MKTYSSKSNAVRGYRSENPDTPLTNEELRDFAVQKDDGRWCVEGEYGFGVPDEDADDVVSDEDEGVENEDGPPVQPLRPIKGTGSYKDVPLRRRSTDGGAVNWAWSVFDSMPADATRKEAIAKAVKVGIAFYTARTQYQRWQHRNDPKPEGK